MQWFYHSSLQVHKHLKMNFFIYFNDSPHLTRRGAELGMMTLDGVMICQGAIKTLLKPPLKEPSQLPTSGSI